jgi:hypothetical protein
MHPYAHVGTKISFPLPACDCRMCLSGSTGDGAASGDRLWRSRPSVKKEALEKDPCSGTKCGERHTHPHPAGGRQALPLHHPRRDSRHAHANAHAHIRPRRHLRTPTVLTTGKPAYTSYIDAKVAQHFETGWGVGVVCCITADPRLRSMTRTPAPDALRPTKSHPFSVIWEDNTDSVVDLRTLLQNVRNYEQGLHKPSTSIPPPTSNGARAHSTAPLETTDDDDDDKRHHLHHRWYPMELQPPLLPPLFPPHWLTLRKHLPLQPPRQERPQALASLTECPPSPATWWISSPATERSHSSRCQQGFREWPQTYPLLRATPHNPSPYISSGPLANSFPPFLCPACDAASLGTSRSMRVAFRKGSGSPFGIRR